MNEERTCCEFPYRSCIPLLVVNWVELEQLKRPNGGISSILGTRFQDLAPPRS
jgi:hypothetical protein